MQESYTHMKNLYEALKFFIQILLYSAFRLSVACSARAAMATAVSPGPGRQIESNTPAARKPTIE